MKNRSLEFRGHNKCKSENIGLGLNVEKTETMAMSKKTVIPKGSVMLNGTRLKQVNRFKYLGTCISSDGKCPTKISGRINQAKSAFTQM